jgi:hypothetical protein
MTGGCTGMAKGFGGGDDETWEKEKEQEGQYEFATETKKVEEK